MLRFSRRLLASLRKVFQMIGIQIRLPRRGIEVLSCDRGGTLGRQAIKYAPPLLFPCLASLASLRYNFTILPYDRRQVETWVVNSQSTNACQVSEAPNRQVILNSTCYSDLQIGVSLSAHCAKECRGLSRPIQKHATAWPRIDNEQSQASPGTQAKRKTPERPRPRDPRSSDKCRGERKRRRAANSYARAIYVCAPLFCSVAYREDSSEEKPTQTSGQVWLSARGRKSV
ncbi:hypothetical protein QBC33DRAFT_28147 [Phialemonium atrogriseum]|uniref:Uncharacterized protein n=1 Tax=Phialemonium atrogriseum TaxID=1093897 RepID=A0AAJ0CCI4_9PEZI|nr:uncharacterized protein QBC33DRAFT_28147 [Phialemonium atrogriseum]KAK1772714.1 hypothetical protein QBC33DRAFT_28147 [Phialemonium atrogriseum]